LPKSRAELMSRCTRYDQIEAMIRQEFFKTKLFEKELSRAGFEDLIDSPFLQRLKGVSFLATMDHIYDVARPFSRYDHSLGAAFLALKLSNQLGLEKGQTEVLVIANLLHDIGHAPFSHAAETFLLEKIRKYHEGLISSYLRFNTRLLPESFSLYEILSNRSKKVEKNVTSLLLNKPTGDSIIDSIHYCSINCDKIDGTNRALFSLGLGCPAPISFLKFFSINGKTVLVNKNKVDDIVLFWRNKIELYNKYIYNNDVLSAEAMLTRSLNLSFDSKNLVDIFIGSTDEVAYNLMNRNEISGKIIELFSTKKLFLPLSSVDIGYFSIVERKLRRFRFDWVNRKKIETEIANHLGIDPQFIISHFSFKKQFKTNLDYLNQLNLFENNYDTMPLIKINKTFYSVRLSGDVLDVFFPPNT